MPTAKDEPQAVRAASLFDPDVLPDLREQHPDGASAVTAQKHALNSTRAREGTIRPSPRVSATHPGRSTATLGAATGLSRGDRRSWEYRCGHCAVGNHHRCPQTVPVGAHLNQPATECVCHSHGHHQTIL